MVRSEENVATDEVTWEELLRLVEARPDLLERLRQVVLTRELLALPEAVRELTEIQRQTTLQIQALAQAQRQSEERLSRLEAAVQELAEAQRRSEERLSRLEAAVQELAEAQRRSEERLSRLEATVQELAEAQRETGRQIQELRQGLEELSSQVHELAQAVFRLTETVTRLEGTVGDIKGRLLEMAYRERPYAYFGRLLRSIRVVHFPEIEDLVEGHLSREEVDELLQLDLLLCGRLREHPERPEVWLAVEVSSVVDKWDVERAKKRAALLQKAGLRVVPVAAGLHSLPEAAHKAEVEGVTLAIDGAVSCWEQALQSALG